MLELALNAAPLTVIARHALTQSALHATQATTSVPEPVFNVVLHVHHALQIVLLVQTQSALHVIQDTI